MQKLHLSDSPLLSDNVLKSLTRNGISTVLELLQEDAEKISVFSELSIAQVILLRTNILQKYSAPLVNAYTLFVDKLCTKTLSTGIESLDELLSGGIPIESMIEVCGLADSGKTQLCIQMAINLVRNSHKNVLYITTKTDFPAVKVQSILDHLGYSHKEMAETMHKMKVVYVWTMDEIIELLSRIKDKTFSVENLALVVIDSLPCLMFQYLGDESKTGLSLLNVFANLCKHLCKEFGLSIICVNIQTRWVDPDISDPEDEESTTLKDQYPTERRQRCLGKYWQHIPALVVQLDKPNIAQNENSTHQNLYVTVLKSNNGPRTYGPKTCVLNLSDSGIR